MLNRPSPPTVREARAAYEAFHGPLVLSENCLLPTPSAVLIHLADTLIVQLDWLWDVGASRPALSTHRTANAGCTDIGAGLNLKAWLLNGASALMAFHKLLRINDYSALVIADPDRTLAAFHAA